jgi:predicted transposase/invertase (TIGR01784 family)
MVAERNETIKKAVATLAKLSEDEKTRMAYDNRQKFIWDQTARENEARAEGRAEGEARGKAEERRNTAQKMLVKGFPLESIRDITDLSIDDIKELQAEITLA